MFALFVDGGGFGAGYYLTHFSCELCFSYLIIEIIFNAEYIVCLICGSVCVYACVCACVRTGTRTYVCRCLCSGVRACKFV